MKTYNITLIFIRPFLLCLLAQPQKHPRVLPRDQVELLIIELRQGVGNDLLIRFMVADDVEVGAKKHPPPQLPIVVLQRLLEKGKYGFVVKDITDVTIDILVLQHDAADDGIPICIFPNLFQFGRRIRSLPVIEEIYTSVRIADQLKAVVVAVEFQITAPLVLSSEMGEADF